VYKNNSESGLNHILKFVKAYSHTNIILLSFPLRHYLMKCTRVNKEVTRFNGKLAKFIKQFEHCAFVNVDINWGLFTNH
jgi:hypothetical protein